jgi:uncharacterized membrane protein
VLIQLINLSTVGAFTMCILLIAIALALLAAAGIPLLLPVLLVAELLRALAQAPRRAAPAKILEETARFDPAI